MPSNRRERERTSSSACSGDMAAAGESTVLEEQIDQNYEPKPAFWALVGVLNGTAAERQSLRWR